MGIVSDSCTTLTWNNAIRAAVPQPEVGELKSWLKSFVVGNGCGVTQYPSAVFR